MTANGLSAAALRDTRTTYKLLLICQAEAENSDAEVTTVTIAVIQTIRDAWPATT